MTVLHAKTNEIPDFTQPQLDALIALGQYPADTTLADIVLPSDWNHEHLIDYQSLTGNLLPQYAPIWNQNTTGQAGTVATINGLISATGTIGLSGLGTSASPYNLKIADSFADSLLGFNSAGHSSTILVGVGLSINGSGVLIATGTPGGSNTEIQFNNNGSFGGATAYWDSTNDWLGINITPEATLDILNTQAFNSGANTAGRFQATGTLGNFAVTVADPANHVGISVNTPDFTTTINDEFNGVGLNMYSSAIASTVQLLSDGGGLFNGYDVTIGANIVIGNGQFFGAYNGSYAVTLGQVSAGFFTDNVNTAYLADGSNAISATGPVNFYDINSGLTNFSVQTGGLVYTSYNTPDDSQGNQYVNNGANGVSSTGGNFIVYNRFGQPFFQTNGNSNGVTTINNIVEDGNSGASFGSIGGAIILGEFSGNSTQVFITPGLQVLNQFVQPSLTVDPSTGSLTSLNNTLDDGAGNGSFAGNLDIANVVYVWPTSSSSGVLNNDGAGNLSWAPAGSGTPGGSQYDVQVNDGSGGFYGDSGLNYNYGTGVVSTTHNTLEGAGAGAVFGESLSVNNHSYFDGVSVESGGLTMVTGFSNNTINLTKGRAAAGGAPLYFYSGGGINLTTPADGAMEYDGTNLFFTIGTTRHIIV